ncbi:MAG: hypothetical protein AAFQ07_13560, partial [Chloroflexota bacterium]
YRYVIFSFIIVRYNDQNNILYSIYGTEATAEKTVRLFMAEMKMAEEVGIENIQGIIYDMRRIDVFSRDNLAAMQRESFRFDSREDLSGVPTAFVVESMMQERIADLLIKMTSGKERKNICFSSAEAHAFFAEWHAQFGKARA